MMYGFENLPCPRRLSPFTGGGYSHCSSRIVNRQPGDSLRFAMKNPHSRRRNFHQIVIWRGIGASVWVSNKEVRRQRFAAVCSAMQKSF